jgi:uncharacterized protein (TIRG00374 family)
MKVRRTALTALKTLVSLGLLAVLYRRIEPARAWSLFSNLSPLLLGVVFGLLAFNTLISALKWRILLDADGIRVPLRQLWISYLIGSFFNCFLPSNIGGDAYRIVDVSRRSAKPVNTVASVFADRLSGFFALSVMGAVFGLAGLPLVRHDRALLLLPCAVFAGIALLAWSLYQQRLLLACLRISGLSRIRRLDSLVARFLASVDAYRRKPGVIARVMAVSFTFQFTVIVCIIVLAAALRLDVHPLYFFVFVPVVSLLEALPVSIYGLGLRDAGYVFFFSQLGLPAAYALTLSLLYVAVTLVYASCGGVAFALRRGRTRARA